MTETVKGEVEADKQAFKVQSLSSVKHAIYILVAFFCFILFNVSCVVVPYEREMYGGYNPPAAELAFTGGCGAILIPLVVGSQRVRPDFMLNSVAVDLGLCLFMWLFLLGGVGALTEQTYDLPACQSLFLCRGFNTMMAFAWMSWILISIVICYLIFLLAQLWAGSLPINWLGTSKELYVEAKKAIGAPKKEKLPKEPKAPKEPKPPKEKKEKPKKESKNEDGKEDSAPKEGFFGFTSSEEAKAEEEPKANENKQGFSTA